MAIDRAYIDYAKFEELTQRSAVYVTKMKKGLVYELLPDKMHMTLEGLMERREQKVRFTKRMAGGKTITHTARIITYVDLNKKTPKLVSLLTNDLDMDREEIIAVYRKRWAIELLFKQLKQNFPLRYFYGESANAIKIQIWTALIANLPLMVMQRRISRPWSFSGLSTTIHSLKIQKETGPKCLRKQEKFLQNQLCLTKGGLFLKVYPQHLFIGITDRISCYFYF